MESVKKTPSFGDDTLSACINAELQNLELFRNDSDMDKYFKDGISFSKLTNKSDNKSLKRNHGSYKNGKENIDRNCTRYETRSSSLSKQRIRNEMSLVNTDNTSVESNGLQNAIFSMESIGTSNREKSTEINQSPSIIPTQDRCKLAAWGLPPNVLRKYEERGISTMFPWQVECLSNHRVIEEQSNLVYSAPTSAGKTLVAEILMIKTILERRRKAIFILPFVSVVREKMYYFKDLLSDSGIRVEGFMGGIVPAGGFSATHVAIATIEKANSLVNRLMEENELINLGAVVIDELHLVGDPNRGYLLELLLTKLKYMTLRDENINIQLIGMSATLPNLSILAEWLNAELYKTEFRPVPLNEQCKLGTRVYDNKLNLIRNLTPMPELVMDTDNILHLCIETISDSHSVLIFCPTKNWCEKLAEQIAVAFYKLGREDSSLGKTLRQQLDSTLISETLEQLKRSPTGLDDVLKSTVSFGIAFHHAGLTMDERDIIEGSFRSGSLRVLVATSTLSSGVNLPARRVIIRSPMFGGRVLDSLTYKQMIGRAGRMGKDTAGESILVCNSNERKAAESLLCATLNPIESCLDDSGPLIRALLEAIASEVVFTPSDVELYTKCTLVSVTKEDNARNPSNEAIKFLTDNEFLLLQKTEEEHRWVATALGKACLAASIPPKEGLFLLEELQKARRCFVLDTELHVVYLVTPINSGSQISTIDWMMFLEQWKALSESERRVGQLVGIEERFLTTAVKGIVKPGKSLSIHRRFYTALALHDLVRETPLNTVCKKYGCGRGVLQSLQQSASTFAGMVTQFCKQLGWDCMELLVSQFQTRLQFGVCRELLDLLRLSMLNGIRARSLYKQGITCVADLATANELDVERALYKALPFESEKEQDGEHESEASKRNKMRTVFVTGKDGLTPNQAALLLVEEARALVQNELKLQDMQWKPNEQSFVASRSATEKSRAKCTAKENNNLLQDTDIDMQQVNGSRSVENTDKEEKSSKRQLQEDEQSKITANTIENLLNPTLNQTNIEDVQSIDPLLQCSVDFFEDSSPRMAITSQKRRTSSESLIKKTQKIRHSKNNDEILNTSSDLRQRISTSPSLFDDSLNINTQICNVLEQNIIDSIDFSDFEEAKLLEDKSTLTPQKDVNVEMDSTTNKQIYEKCIELTDLHGKESQLSWKDDSWNESKKIMEKLNKMEKTIEKKVPVVNNNIRDIKNTSIKNISEVAGTSKSTVYANRKSSITSDKSIDDSKGLKGILQKRRFTERTAEMSPIVKLYAFSRNRAGSFDSNKSDSDDIVSGSQNVNSPATSIKIRSRLDSAKKKKLYTQKIPTTTTNTNNHDDELKKAVASKNIQTKEYRIKPKLNEILAQIVLPRKDHSIDSVISNSEDDTPTKPLRTELQKAGHVGLKKNQVNLNKPGNFTEVKDGQSSTDWNTLNIIKVGTDRGTFNLFKRELMHKKYIALALNCEMYTNEGNNIGSKIISSTNSERKKRSKKVETCNVHADKKICGAAISWENNIAYYISFSNEQESKITGKEQLKLLKELLSNTLLYVKCFSTKQVFKLLHQCSGIFAKCKFLDPKTGDWLYDGNNTEKTFNEMVKEYWPEGSFIAKRVGCCSNTGPGLNIKSALPGEFRASAEAVLVWHVTDVLLDKLEDLNPMLLYTFKDIEMKTITILSCMELNGMGVCLKSLQDLSSVIREEMISLEKRAYALSGKKFNFSSSKQVGEILGLCKGKTASSVNKAALEHSNHPISSLVISWRKLSATQSKIIYPLLNLAQNGSRIHGNCVTRTLTGRISMHEPNLQNVPKDFHSEDNSFVISVRMAFMPAVGNVMLSADYCQLELRILAHYSKDQTLCDIMRRPGDIFKNIAANWNDVSEEEVDDKMRQSTKQLCYGMIYGMGVKTLADNLCVDEMKAKEFQESFMNAYPGIRRWLDNVLEKAHKDGYVTTLLERRRILPGLTSRNLAEKSQAERQAVNTTIQGSAADIAKRAMINIEDRMRYEFSNSSNIMSVYNKRKLRSNSRDAEQRGGYLVLQLHDELLYEVNINDLKQVATIVKESMEQVCQLAVPLPVKIKVGPAWGDLSEYHF